MGLNSRAPSSTDLLWQEDDLIGPLCSSDQPALLVQHGSDDSFDDENLGSTAEDTAACDGEVESFIVREVCKEILPGDSSCHMRKDCCSQGLRTAIEEMLNKHHRSVELAIDRVVEQLREAFVGGLGAESIAADDSPRRHSVQYNSEAYTPQTSFSPRRPSVAPTWLDTAALGNGVQHGEFDETMLDAFGEFQEPHRQDSFDRANAIVGTPTDEGDRRKAAARRISREHARSFAISKEDELMNEPQPCWLHETLKSMTDSVWFQVVGAFLIFSNSALIGLEVDYMARHAGQSPTYFGNLHLVYTVVFTIEWLIRVIAEGKDFILVQLHWNLLDTFVVICAVLESISDILTRTVEAEQGDGLRSVTAVRMFRVLRFLRLVRVLRIPRIIRFVGALRTLVHSVVCTLRELFWSVVLLFLLIYVAGIVFCQAAIDYQGGTKDQHLDKFWGTLPDAMLTLFMIISNGVSWIQPLDPLRELSILWVYASVCYVFFTYFAVLNVITGIFCNSAIETAARDPDLVAQSLSRTNRKYMNKVRALFKSMDTDDSGSITFEELETLMKNEEMQVYFQAMGLETDDAWTLFKLIDCDSTHTIDVNEFVAGVMRLKGSAKSIDLALMCAENKEMVKKLWSGMTKLQAQLERISQGQRKLCAHFQPMTYRKPSPSPPQTFVLPADCYSQQL